MRLSPLAAPWATRRSHPERATVGRKFNTLATGMQMPMHMGWMSPYHALMIQQQQAAMLGSNVGLPPVGKSPKRDKPLLADQNPDSREHHSVFDVLTSGDLKRHGYGWMTTRTASLPIGSPAGSSNAALTSSGPKKKVVKGLHPDFDFEVQSLKAWNAALDKGPQIWSANHPDASASFGAKRRAQSVFWRLCLMMNSIYLHKGARRLDSRGPPKAAEEMI